MRVLRTVWRWLRCSIVKEKKRSYALGAHDFYPYEDWFFVVYSLSSPLITGLTDKFLVFILGAQPWWMLPEAA